MKDLSKNFSEENVVGQIDDVPMLVADYDFHVANYLNFTRPQRASGQLTAQDTVDALNYAWDILIRRELENKKANEFGLIISDNEKIKYLRIKRLLKTTTLKLQKPI